MALFEGKTPAERNKMIAAVVLPLLALVFVVRMLFGSSTPTRTAPNNNNRRQTANANAPRPNPGAPDVPKDVAEVPTEVVYEPVGFDGPSAGRNIFAYYVPPPPRPAAAKPAPTEQLPTPTPPPPIALANISPASVYARTSGFTMQITGDKFTPESRVYLDGQEMPTQFRGPQQLSATVPASSLAAPGTRTVVVRTPDNTLFSNSATINVMQPPAPTHTYVGMIARPSGGDTALLKNQKGDLVGVQAGDIVEGRFRVAGINANAVELVDKDLNVRHSLPYVEVRSTGGPAGRVPGSIQPPPPPKPDDDGDDEP